MLPSLLDEKKDTICLTDLQPFKVIYLTLLNYKKKNPAKQLSKKLSSKVSKAFEF